MKRVFSFLVFVVLFFCGCSSSPGTKALREWMRPSAKIKVLCTISMIEDLVKRVGGERVDTLTLIAGELDPHSYQLVKGDDEKLAVADIIFYNGLGLEHGPSLRAFLSESEKAVGLGDRIMEDRPEKILHYNGTVDPHIWMDIALWKETVDFIVQALQAYDSEYSAYYRENGEKLKNRLAALHGKLVQRMREVPENRRYLVTSHDAFNYFARSYLATFEEQKEETWQKRFAAPEGLAPESQLSTSDIRLILGHMKTYGIGVIFPESNVSRASIRKLQNAGEELGLRVTIAPDHLYGDAMGPPGSSGDTYEKMLSHNIETIARYLDRENGKQ